MSQLLEYRNRSARTVAGVMSGTSMDGIDVALIEISGTGVSLTFRLLHHDSVNFPDELRARMIRAAEGDTSVREVAALDVDLGACYAEAIRTVSSEAAEIREIDAVGLHGQTIYHDPRRQPHGITMQIGSAAVVMEAHDAIVVNDFRRADVAAGGEGAPLVPYCDWLLLQSPDKNRIVLNIGGIANLTWLPYNVSSDEIVAFDTGPGNILLDSAMRELYGRDYDEIGAVAASGKADEAWVEELLKDPFFAQAPPKSTGREHFGTERAHELLSQASRRGTAPADLIASLTLLTARSVARAIVEHAAGGKKVDEVVVGGGGAHNKELMRLLASEISGARILPSDELGLPSDAKEAICFALLANEAICETPASLPSVTGARHPVILGALWIPV